MSLNVNELCSQFYNGTRLERAKTNNTISINNNELENKILARELQAHKLDSDVDFPSYFHPTATLINNPHKLGESLKVFPRAQMFSGSTRDGQMSVVEYLTYLTVAQEQCRLSEPEFIARMLSSSTGLAHELINMWAQNGSTARQIYNNLLIHFDKRPPPEEAKLKLYSYRVSKNENLAKAEGQISLLANMAAKSIPAGISRTNFIDLESCNALIRALPEWSSIQVSNLHKSLSAKLGRTLTFSELDQALHALRTNIDLDISQNGQDFSRTMRVPPGRYPPQGRFSSYNLDIKEKTDTISTKVFSPRRSRTDISYTPKPTYRPRSRSTGRFKKNSSNINTAVKSSSNRGGAFKRFNTKPEANRDRSNSRNRYNNTKKAPFNSNNNTKGCVLCGMSNHKAETCRMIRDDQGNIKSIIPGYGVCSKCPSHVMPRLHHPESLCPFRPNGPMFKKSH